MKQSILSSELRSDFRKEAFGSSMPIDHWIDRLTTQSNFLETFVRGTMPNALRRFVGVSDVVQSVWLRVNRNRLKLGDLSEIQFRAWVLCVARRKIIDSLRRHHLTEQTRHRLACSVQKRLSPSDEGSFPEPIHLLTLHEQADRLMDALTSLPSEIQQIVSLRYSDGLTFQQIAEKLSLPVTTCRRRWLEGCELLRERLGDLV